jgi:hypothetical protein
MKEKQRQLPARLNSEQVGQFFGFQAQEIKALIQVGLLKPLRNRSNKGGRS